MTNEESVKRTNLNRKSVRPEFAEDVYGGSAKTEGSSGVANRGSTITVSGNRYSQSSMTTGRGRIAETLSNTSLSSLSQSTSDSNFVGPINWHDSSKFEPYGESYSREDLDHKSRQYVGELNFQYADCDKFSVELAELYTYSEMEDFLLNFEEFCMYLLRSKYEKTERWIEWSADSKSRLIQDVLQGLESADSITRLDSARLILYILQGTYGDYADVDDDEKSNDGEGNDNASQPSDSNRSESRKTSDEEYGFFRKISQKLRKTTDVLTPSDVEMSGGKNRGTGGNEEHCLLNAATNAYFIYESGLFQPLCAMLAMEREESSRKHLAKQQSVLSLNSSASLGSSQSLPTGGHRRSATLADNESLRVVMNCLYHMVESIRRPELIPQIAEFCRNLSQQHPRATSPYCTYTVERLIKLRENFINELDEPLDSSKVVLVMFLFDMMPDLVRGKCPHFPIKKMLLLAWKILLATLGGIDVLREEKARKRHAAGLSLMEDTLEVAGMLKPVVYGNDNESDVFISKLSRIGLKNPKVVSMECGKMRFLNRQTACASAAMAEDNSKSRDDDDNYKIDKPGDDLADDDNLNDDAFQSNDDSAENPPSRKSSDVEAPITPKADDGKTSDSNGAVFKYSGDKNDNKVQEGQSSDAGINCKNAKLNKALEQKLERALNRPPKGTPFPRRFHNPSVASSIAGDQTPRAGSPSANNRHSIIDALARLNTLPWRTKVREKDLETFLQKERQKYFGYQLANDSTTLFGLPSPVIQSVSIFHRHIYVSLSELQLKAEAEYNRFTFSRIEKIEETRTERLYQRMVPNMTEYVITLLKVILASLPSSKTKSEAVTILSDVLTPETDTNEMLSNSMSLDISGKNVLEEAVRFAIDVNRHKELIAKASSAIIIMLLKFFRLNHVYQFESFAQYLVLANSLPLVLKFMDQNILRYIQSKHELTPLNYPQCALHYVRNDGEWPVLNADNVYEYDTEQSSYYLWRNVFSSINLLRVLNKLTKWKYARTMMLVVFKSAPVLKRCMRVRLGIFQLYVLKLLKMQARFLGRQWRKSNMDIMSSIYMKVRHRLNDDWAFANETRTKTWDFQIDENKLGVFIKRFNMRRYKHLLGDDFNAGINNNVTGAERNATSKQDGGADSNAVRNKSGRRAPYDDDDFDGADDNGNEEDVGVVGDDDMSVSRLLYGIDPRDFESYDNCLQSVLSWQPKFSERFTKNYTKWVDDEVINSRIDWDFLLSSTQGIAFEDKF